MPRLLELFSGTGSIGKAAHGWDVWDLDISPQFSPRICVDILEWNYKDFAPGFFDAVWASIPCQEYSVLHTKSTRDLTHANSITNRTREILAYFNAPYAVENPRGSMLWIMTDWPYITDTSYCQYNGGFHGYRKHTRVASNFLLVLRPMCRGGCDATVDGRHQTTAQRGTQKTYELDRAFTVSELWEIPSELCALILSQLQRNLHLAGNRLESEFQS